MGEECVLRTSVIRLHIIAEGQTEQSFVKKVLAGHLADFNVFADARCVLTSKDKRAAVEFRGGLSSYQRVKKDILTWLKEDSHSECRFTTMFDLYALPDDFPKYEEAKKKIPYKRVDLLEEAMRDDIADGRFIPYIQLHEFEALILASPQQLDWEYLEHEKPIAKLINMARDKNPELIDDGQETAPSKRILEEIPEYDKVTAGVSVARRIGLETLREKCRHFHEWITRLEKLGVPGSVGICAC
jgi:hypothetical protein